MERITKFKLSNVKLHEDMRLLKERKKRRSLSLKPRALENLVSENSDCVLGEASGVTKKKFDD